MNCLGILFRYRFCFITSGLGPGVLLSEYQGFRGLAWQKDGPPLRVADAGPRVHRALRVESQWILVLCGFYKVAEYRISKYWTIDAEGNTELGLCKPWSQHFCHLINTQSCFICASFFFLSSLVAQWLRICLPMQEPQEMWVWSLGRKGPLEKDMATHSSILAWEMPQTEGPGGPQSMGSQRVGYD